MNGLLVRGGHSLDLHDRAALGSVVGQHVKGADPIGQPAGESVLEPPRVRVPIARRQQVVHELFERVQARLKDPEAAVERRGRARGEHEIVGAGEEEIDVGGNRQIGVHENDGLVLR